MRFKKKGDKHQIKKVQRDLRDAESQLCYDFQNCSCIRCQSNHYKVLHLRDRLALLLESQVVDFDNYLEE